MYHASLPFSEGELGKLIHKHVLPSIDLLDCVAAFSDDYKSHLTVFVDNHAADFGIGSFAASGRFIVFEL
jgi:hypothetical protein